MAASAENIYRWTDENGKVHYGRTLPPDHSNLPYEFLNDQGVVIKRVDDPMESQKPVAEIEESDERAPLFTADEVRIRSDRLLVLLYHSEEDLIAAMEVEVDQLSYDTRLINQSQSSAMTSLAGQVKNAADRQRAGMPDDPGLGKNIYRLRQRLRKSEDQLQGLKDREIKIRASFQDDIERYRFLANGGKPGEIDES